MTERVADLEGVPRDGTFLFTVRDVDAGEDREAILVRVDGVRGDGSWATGDDGTGGSTSSASGATGASGEGEPRVRGWLNYCRHLTHVRLDKGRGATMRGDEIVCTNHGAMFEADSGLCTFGPCEGATLERVEVSVEDGAVYLTDDRYAFVGTGPAESGDRDLTSTSNVEF